MGPIAGWNVTVEIMLGSGGGFVNNVSSERNPAFCVVSYGGRKRNRLNRERIQLDLAGSGSSGKYREIPN